MVMKVRLLPVLLVAVLLMNVNAVSAHSEEGFAQAEQLIESGISCESLTEEQLELIGDYYMEQMHPGEAHEAMDEMMGGEGSESLRQMHIQMAENNYCGKSSGMMWMMPMMGSTPQAYGFWGTGNLILTVVMVVSIIALAIAWFYKRR